MRCVGWMVLALALAGCEAGEGAGDVGGDAGLDNDAAGEDGARDAGGGAPDAAHADVTAPLGDAVPAPTDGAALDAVADARVDADAGPPTPDAEPPTPDAGPRFVEAQNPVLPGPPDPHVLRVERPEGPLYVLYGTIHNNGDLPAWTSTDLIHWERRPEGLFRRQRAGGDSLEINGGHYCSIWAPEVAQVRDGVFLLSFSAQRYARPQSPCPPYREDGGVYFASSASPFGPFAVADRPWEPLAVGGHITDCPANVKGAIPRSLNVASRNCQGTFCHHIVRLDSNVWRDPLTGRWWLGYAWYTNDPPMVPWEEGNHGEHVSLVELDAADPFTVRCDVNVAQLHIANPHDGATRAALAASCGRCGEMLDFTRGRQGEVIHFSGRPWGIVEGSSLFRRGDWVYALVSGSAWDSAWYQVYWIAARSVEDLRMGGARLVGRYLIPSNGQAFGHGSPVLGPDGASWYYVHHRLDAGACRASGRCDRDVWVSPIEFEDRGDGRGDVWIRARFPAETPGVRVRL